MSTTNGPSSKKTRATVTKQDALVEAIYACFSEPTTEGLFGPPGEPSGLAETIDRASKRIADALTHGTSELNPTWEAGSYIGDKLESGLISVADAIRELADAVRGKTDSNKITMSQVQAVWPELIKKVGQKLCMSLVAAEPVRIESHDVVIIQAKPGYDSLADLCGSHESEGQIACALQNLLRENVIVRYLRKVKS